MQYKLEIHNLPPYKNDLKVCLKYNTLFLQTTKHIGFKNIVKIVGDVALVVEELHWMSNKLYLISVEQMTGR